ncbi:MAG: hypothetical protein P1V35_12800 [Planctomycetota bacterium]|nr:hypothetical protein [Planctomycetota bacterium]
MKISTLLPIVLLPLALAFTSCTKNEEAPASDGTQNAIEDVTNAAQDAANAVVGMFEGVHSVECGCSDVVTTTKDCGNYVQVGGAYLEIEGDLGLGVMEWCGQHGVNAQVKGEAKDGKFMTESLTVVP